MSYFVVIPKEILQKKVEEIQQFPVCQILIKFYELKEEPKEDFLPEIGNLVNGSQSMREYDDKLEQARIRSR